MVLLIALAPRVRQTSTVENRFIVADQSDWGGKKGFYISIENAGPAGTPLNISTARLILGVGDGTSWRFVTATGILRTDKTYHVAAHIAATSASLTLDGKSIGTSNGGFVATGNSVTFGDRPSWAAASANYRIEESAYHVVSGFGTLAGAVPAATADLLSLFEEPEPMRIPMTFSGAARTDVEATFHVMSKTPAMLNGLVDRYGQASPADWPDKVGSDADLRKSADEEQARTQTWRRPADWDAYGGLTSGPWHERPTGYFGIAKHDGRWWLISPKGNPLFYTGICTAPALRWEMTPVSGRENLFAALPARTGPEAELWQDTSPWGDGPAPYFSPEAWNLLRKFGTGWRTAAAAEFHRRMDAWAFSGQGKWADLNMAPRTVVIGLDVPKLVRHPDVFDSAVQAQVRAAMTQQVSAFRTDPNVVGYTVGSEFDEIVTTDEIRTILKDHPQSAAAKAMIASTGAGPASDDAAIERARRFYAQAYYGLLYRTAKAIDPNHLYLGNWIVPNWWQNDADWDLIAANCDVIGYDNYAPRYDSAAKLIARFDKPTFVGEFGFPASHHGTRGYGRFTASDVATDADAGQSYAAAVHDASRDPRCIGMNWFQYRDEPLTGRGPGKGAEAALGEHFAFGLVDVTDRPKWDLVTQVRAANLRATRDRFAP